MTRILSYNILVGGAPRLNQITDIIRSADPDVVGLVEATDPQVVKELAQELGMDYSVSGYFEYRRSWEVALLSRLPIIRSQVYEHPEILSRPLLEVCVEEADGNELTLFVAHLSAAFNQGRGGDSIRRGEVGEILRILAPAQGNPHLLMGDFNALAPGDCLKGSMLLRYVVAMDQKQRENAQGSFGYPHLDFVIPPAFHLFNPILRLIPRSKLLCALFDEASSLYAPHGSIGMLLKAGYVDCFRYMNPRAWGFTCPASAPAGRIDFIFASPEMAARLSGCRVITEGNSTAGDRASDHFPVLAEFGERVDGNGNEEDNKGVSAMCMTSMRLNE